MSASSPCNRERFGRYELIERIGAGGMAEVFRARAVGPLGFERELVVKRIRPEFADDAMIIQMFSDEAKLSASANHRNVVQVFELGASDDGQVFMVMEHVAGMDLKEVQLRAWDHDRRIPPWFSVHVVAEVLAGLSFMHGLVDPTGRRRNVVHRDVSPENIFISRLGDVKLGDFGIAQDDTRPDALMGRDVKGKPGYSAPEHLEGSAPDQRFDVFSAGVVLWECLTQRPLFSGDDRAQRVRGSCPALEVPPSHFTRDVPPEVDAIVLRALTADPDARTATTDAMRRELLSALHRMRPQRIDATEVASMFGQLVARDADQPEVGQYERDLASALSALLDDGPVHPVAPMQRTEPSALGTLEPFRRRFEDGRTYAIISPAKVEKTRRRQTNDRGVAREPRIRRLVI